MGVNIFVTGSAKRGLISFSKFSTLVNHISAGFQVITFKQQWCVRVTFGPNFKLMLNSQIKLWDSKYV